MRHCVFRFLFHLFLCSSLPQFHAFLQQYSVRFCGVCSRYCESNFCESKLQQILFSKNVSNYLTEKEVVEETEEILKQVEKINDNFGKLKRLQKLQKFQQRFKHDDICKQLSEEQSAKGKLIIPKHLKDADSGFTEAHLLANLNFPFDDFLEDI